MYNDSQNDALCTPLSSSHTHTCTDLPPSTLYRSVQIPDRTHRHTTCWASNFRRSFCLARISCNRLFIASQTQVRLHPLLSFPRCPLMTSNDKYGEKLERPFYTKASLCFPFKAVLFHYRTLVGVRCVFLSSACHKNINGRAIHEHL